jgi:serine/threonine protein phosphatase PrpC
VSESRCPACGAVTGPEHVFCESCGVPLGAPVAEEHRMVDLGRAAAVCHPGLVRPSNQDALALATPAGGVVAVVCDGVASSQDGGAAAERAAAAAADSLAVALDAGSWHAEDAARTAVDRARAAVASLDAPAESYRSPSCTLVAAVWDGELVTIASVGDSRAYWIAPGGSRQLTVDDSWVQEQVSVGAVSERTARHHAQAHAITNWIGADAPDVPCRVVGLRPGARGRLVLCTDGLWNAVPDAADIERIVTPGEPAPIEAARRLLDAALRSGGRDNVTVAVVEVEP